MSDRLNMEPDAAWRRTGFMVKRHPRSLIEFSDLNPQVEFRTVIGRWDRLKLAAWFAWAAFAPELEEQTDG